MGILTILILFLVIPDIILDIGETSAIGQLPGSIQDTIVGLATLLTVMATAMGFLSTGIVAMVGSVRTANADPEAQTKADFMTGKILQLGTLFALIIGSLCTMATYMLYH